MSAAKRESVHIWINRVLDDASTVSSLSTAYMLEASSSFQDTDDHSVVSFDLTLLEDDDIRDSSRGEQLLLEEEEDNDDMRNNCNCNDWRWKSDPTLPMHRNIDMPVIPLRRSSGKSPQKMLLHKDSTNQATLARLFQKPRMPKRKPSSDANSKKCCNEDAVTESTGPESSSRSSAMVPERLRRFPLDLPKRKLPASSRLKRLTRPTCRTPPTVTVASAANQLRHEEHPNMVHR